MAQALLSIPAAKCKANPSNTRGALKPEDVADLTASIKEVGQIAPVLVEKKGDIYEVVAGHRRVRACEVLGLAVLAIEVNAENKDKTEAMILAENLVRLDADPWKEAELVRRLREDEKMTRQQIAAVCGRDAGWVAKRENIIGLPKPVVKMMRDNGWTPDMIGLGALVAKRMTAEEAVATLSECHTVDNLRALLSHRLLALVTAPFPTEDETLVPKAGACAVCPKNSANEKDLFGGLVQDKGKDLASCTDQACWRWKWTTHLTRTLDEAMAKYPGKVVIIAQVHTTKELGLAERHAKVPVEYPWNLKAVTEKAPNARFGVLWCEPRNSITKSGWVNSYEDDRKADKKKDPKAKKDKPKSEKAVIEASALRTDTRRRADVVIGIAEGIRKTKCEGFVRENLLGLTAIFGGNLQHHDAPKDLGSVLRNIAQGEDAKWEDGVWRTVRESIASRLALPSMDPDSVEEVYEDAYAFVDTLGLTGVIKVEDLEAAAKKDHPYSKKVAQATEGEKEAKAKK